MDIHKKSKLTIYYSVYSVFLFIVITLFGNQYFNYINKKFTFKNMI